MGVCSSCFGSNEQESNNINLEYDATPDPEVRRRQQLEAVEKRLKNQEYRGIKNPEKVRRMQEKALEKERLEDQIPNYGGNNNLRWQVS